MLDIAVFKKNAGMYAKSFMAAGYGNNPVVLYGTGLIAKEMVSTFSGINIVGILDRNTDNIGKSFCNLPILSMEETLKANASIIIATDSKHWRVIFNRIRYIKDIHGVQIFFPDAVVADPSFFEDEDEKNGVKFCLEMEIDSDDLKKAIDRSEVISFDVFDTLLTRKVLQPSDLFDLWEIRVIKKYPKLKGISFIRKEAAQKVRQKFGDCYNLTQVYEWIGIHYSLAHQTVEELMEMEYDLELDCIVPRDEVVQCLFYALENGKTVNLVSDMYMSPAKMESLLTKCGINGYNRLYVSSTVGGTKHSGTLWDLYLEEYRGKKCLHVGDNEKADFINAKAHNIKTIRIMSSYEILEHLFSRRILQNVDSTYDSVVTGLFTARIFNSPFSLKQMNGTIAINNLFDYGYLFFGPLILEYLIWMIKEFKETTPGKVLFFARDGFLLEKLYNKLRKKLGVESLPEGIYFKTSRRMASVAGINSSEDAFKLLKLYFQGSPYSLLFNRFGIDCSNCPDDEVITHESKEAKRQVATHMSEILASARKERDAYIKYFEELGVTKCASIAVCDYMTKGSIQFWLTKLLNENIQGYYMLIYGENEYSSGLKMNSRYRCKNPEELAVGNYRLIESILTAPEGTYLKVNDDGTFENSAASANSNSFIEIEEVHKGIETFIFDLLAIYDNIFEAPLNKNLINEIFGIINSQNCQICEEIIKACRWNSAYTGLVNPSLSLCENPYAPKFVAEIKR